MSTNLGNATGVTIKIGTQKVFDYESYIVRRDIGQPDEAEIVLSSVKHSFSLGDPVEVKVKSLNAQGTVEEYTTYVGEVVSIAATFGDSDKQKPATRVTAMNLLHRLNRSRRSEVFEGKSDSEIIKKVLLDAAGLKLVEPWPEKYPNFVHKVVHWTNQTPMEFLSMRAERYGFHFWCVDKEVHYKVPDLETHSPFRLMFPPQVSKKLWQDVAMQSFLPRMSSSKIVEKVRVRASDPINGKEPIMGVSDKGVAALGKRHAVEACGPEYEKYETIIVDVPVFSEKEADAVANAEFLRRSLSFITAEAVASAKPQLQLGTTVEVEANRIDKNDPFNGRYYVTGITHRWTVLHSSGKPHQTHLRLARDASGPKG